MKRMKNSVKAIIISAVAIICVVAIVLGVVFGTKKDQPNNPGGQNPIIATYAKLIEDINLSRDSHEYQIVEDIPYQIQNTCSNQNLTSFGKNYFTFIDGSGDENFYVYKKNEAGEYKFYNLTNKTNDLNNPGFVHKDAIGFEVGDYNDEYVVIISNIDGEDIQSESLVYIGGSEPVEIFKYDNLDAEISGGSYSGNFIKDHIKLIDNFFAFSVMHIEAGESIEQSEMEVVVYASKYPTSKIDIDSCLKTSALASSELKFVSEIMFYDSRVEINSIDYKEIIRFDGTNLKSDKIYFSENSDENVVGLNVYEIGNEKFLIERQLKTNSNNQNAILSTDYGFIEYKYSIIDYSSENAIETEFKLKSGYGYLSAQRVSNNSNYFYVCQQKLAENQLTNEFISQYYDQNSNLMFEYSSAENEQILYGYNNKFITISKTFSAKSDGTISVLVDFSRYENSSVNTESFFEGKFIFETNGYCSIMDLDGNVIVGAVDNSNEEAILFSEIFAIKDGFALGVFRFEENINFYELINVSTGEIYDIDGVFENQNMLMLLQNGYGLYVAENDNEGFSLYKNGSTLPLIEENIDDIKFSESVRNGAVVEIYTDTKNYAILVKSDKTFGFVNQQNDEESVYIQNYSSFIENYNNDGFGGDYDNHSWDLTLNDSSGNKIGTIYWYTYQQGWDWGGGAPGHQDHIWISLTGYYLTSFSFKIHFNSSKDYSVTSAMSATYFSSSTVTSNNNHSGSATVSGTTVKYDWPKYSTRAYYLQSGSSIRNSSNNNVSSINLTYSTNYKGIPYTLTFGNSDKSSITIEYGKTYKTSSYSTTKTGYTFKGWSTNSYSQGSNIGTTITYASDFTCTGNVTWYAVWEANSYTIKCDPNNGGSETRYTAYYYLSDLKNTLNSSGSHGNKEPYIIYIEKPTRIGYTFTSWSVSGMSSGITKYYGTSSTTANSTLASSSTTSTTTSYSYFRNLRSSSGTVTFTANWTANHYGLQFVYRTSGGNAISYATLNKNTGVYDNTEGGTLGRNFAVGTGVITLNGTTYSTYTTSVIVSGCITYPPVQKKIFNAFRYSNSCFDGSNAYYALYNTEYSTGMRYFQYTSLSGNYQLVDWAVLYDGKFYSINSDKVAEGTVSFDDLIRGLSDNSNITLYAVYAEREYYIDAEWAAVDGSALTSSDDINNKLASTGNNTNFTKSSGAANNNVNFVFETTDDAKLGTSRSESTQKSNLFLGKYKQSVQFKIEVSYPYYVIDKIQFLYFPYVSGSTYKRVTLTFDLDWSTSGVTYTASCDNGLTVSGTNNTGYYLNSGANVIKFTSYQYGNGLCSITVTITNLSYPSTADSENTRMKDAVLNKDSVDASGTYGFTVKPIVTSDYMKPDVVSGATSFTAGTQKNITNGYTKYYAVPVSGTVVWLNGVGYQLKNANGSSNSSAKGYYSQYGTTFRYVGTNSSMTSNGMIYYSGSDYAYYITGSYNVNYNNTEFIAISPEQANIYTSTGSSTISISNSYYELSKYLSNITIGSTTLELPQPKRELENYYYGNLCFADGNDWSSASGSIDYFGTSYTKLASRTITTKIGNITYSYVLYLAYNSSNNHTMYFLVSTSPLPTGSNAASTVITFGFSDFDTKITVNQSVANTGDYYSSTTTTGATTSYIKNGSTSSTSRNDSFSLSNVNPKDTYIFTITPNAGYLIDSIVITIGGKTLFSFKLDYGNLSIVHANDGGVDRSRFYAISGSGTNQSISNYIKYTKTSVYHPFNSFVKSSLNTSLTSEYGLYVQNYYNSTGWGLSSTNGVYGFETLYLLVAGIYDNVEVTVKTISYFEFEIKDANDSILGLDNVSVSNGLVTKWGGNLTIAYKDGSSWSNITNFIGGQNNYVYLTKYNDYRRIIFFGAASFFKNGLAMYASGSDYSNYFTNAKFYDTKDSVTLDATNYVSSSSIWMSGNYDQVVMLQAKENLSTLFNKSTSDYIKYESTGTTSSTRKYISSNKYVLMLDVIVREVSITSESYLANGLLDEVSSELKNIGQINTSSSYGYAITTSYAQTYKKDNLVTKKLTIGQQTTYKYQLDDPQTKLKSWFNDTTLSDINYYVGGSSSVYSYWQQSPKGVSISGVQGYGIKIVYNKIAGYSLNYVDIYTSKTGWFYLPITTFNTKGTVYTIRSGSQNLYVSYKVVFNTNSIEIYLYDTQTSNSIESAINSLGILSGDIEVNFYSNPYTFDVNYYSNVGNSSSATVEHMEVKKDVITYDQMTLLDSQTFSMTGYTFIGWGSKTYAGEDRYDGSSNSWNSSSNFVDMSAYFASGNQSKLIELLKNSKITSYDFYVAGGYFLTDTGFRNPDGTGRASSIQPENYNFWSAYYKLFASNISNSSLSGSTIYKGKSIDLYGIWKANTYNIILDLNDVGSGNGSTSTGFKYKNGVFNEDLLMSGVINPGQLKYSSTGNSGDIKTFYLYITFDTNDWYILTDKKSGDVYSNISSATTKQSLSDYIIDRYGYTWLGWFGERISGNYRQTENNLNRSAVAVSVSNRYKSLTGNSSSAFPTLDLTNYNRFNSVGAIQDQVNNIYSFSTTGSGNTSVYSQNIYSALKDNNINLSKFIYKGELGSSNNYLYFYNYKNASNPGAYTTTTLVIDLNPWGTSGTTEYICSDLLNDYLVSKYNSYFTYFDTAIDYMSYRSGENQALTWHANTSTLRYLPTDSDSTKPEYYQKINNYRSITIYSYWQTNYYKFIVDYRDCESGGTDNINLTKLGSTSVGLTGYTFASAYFDDDTLTDRLNKFNLVRIGYDFDGWSFDPQITNPDGSIVSQLGEYSFGARTTYKLGNEITNYLFTTDAGRSTLYAGLAQGTSYTEKLGDTEGESDHYVYMFAGWTAQTFTINVSLNIAGEGLLNLYRADSEFALALYGASESGIDVNSYTGIKQKYAMADPNTFTDVVANVSFVITFDTFMKDARFVIGSDSSFSLDRLFATSSGYYLLGWLYDPTNADALLVRNTLMSTFGLDGNVENIANGGTSALLKQNVGEDIPFDITFYKKLYVSNYIDGVNSYKKLSEVDAVGSRMDITGVISSGGVNYFNTFSYSASNSSNFGFITIGSNDYYLRVKKVGLSYYMYYIDASGNEKMVQPYIVRGGNNVLANGANSDLTFDDSNFYYGNYVIYFDNQTDYNAYYTTGTYQYSVSSESGSDCNRLKIIFVSKDSIDDNDVSKSQLLFTPKNTRQFTIYAHWINKVDLNASISNGNNSSTDQTSSSNLGLAGNFTLENSNVDNLETTGTAHVSETPATHKSVSTFGDDQVGIDLVLNYYDTLKYGIMSYYNGRYLSELKLTFYSYEDIASNSAGLTTTYKKVTYVLTLKFIWDSENRTIKIDTTSSTLIVDGVAESGIKFNIENGVLKIEGISKLSNIDDSAFENGFMKIGEYGNRDERIDINYIEIEMLNVKSSMSIECKFSVQTFDVEFYNVFDGGGFSLTADASTTGNYTISGYDSVQSLLGETDSARYSDGTSHYGVILDGDDVLELYKTDKIATISTDCSEQTTSYNVPYGFFIYGNNQLEAPNDVKIGMGTEKFGGYDHIYANSNYKYGSTESVMNTISDQCSPILGEPGLYSESVRKTSTLYTFYSWFEEGVSGGNFILKEFSQNDELSYVNRNIYLIGYYYANNKPTNIQFYTWDKDAESYVEYKENINDYTLQSTTINSAYSQDGSTLLSLKDANNAYIDETGRVIAIYNESYGIDGVRFDSDNYTDSYISNDVAQTNSVFVNNTLIRTYWYYSFVNYYLFFEEGDVKHYIRLDTNNSRFYYLSDESNLNSDKNYVNLYTDGLNDAAFAVYMDKNPASSGIVINSDTDLKKYIEQNKLTKLTNDSTEYVYNLAGSEMYVHGNNNAEYYKIKKFADYMTDAELTAEEKQELTEIASLARLNIAAKYYVKYGGEVYFMIVSNGNNSSTSYANAFYSISLVRDEDGNVTGGSFENATAFNSQVSIDTIDKYYIRLEDEFFEVKYQEYTDEYGVSYIRPYTTVGTCDLTYVENGVTINVTVYFDYTTKVFYKNYSEGELSNRLTTDDIPNYRSYTPVNDNYTVIIKFNDETRKWSYDSVKINSLPSPNIGPWYNGTTYNYIGYINVQDNDIGYLVNPVLDTVDESGNKTDPNKVQYKDRIYDTIVKYIDSFFVGYTPEQIESLKKDAYDYVLGYQSNKTYLSTLITVADNGYIYKEGTNIIEYIDALITCKVPFNIDGRTVVNEITVKYRFSMINSDTTMNENIYAIPIYCRGVMNYTSNAISATSNAGLSVTIDTSELDVEYFEIIANNYTHKYNKQNGDYLRFAVLTTSQYNSITNSRDYPTQLNYLMSDSAYGIFSNENPTGIPIYNEEDSASNMLEIGFNNLGDGTYYILAYYNKSSLDYAIRVSDNVIRVVVADGKITAEIV